MHSEAIDSIYIVHFIYNFGIFTSTPEYRSHVRHSQTHRQTDKCKISIMIAKAIKQLFASIMHWIVYISEFAFAHYLQII